MKGASLLQHFNNLVISGATQPRLPEKNGAKNLPSDPDPAEFYAPANVDRMLRQHDKQVFHLKNKVKSLRENNKIFRSVNRAQAKQLRLLFQKTHPSKQQTHPSKPALSPNQTEGSISTSSQRPKPKDPTPKGRHTHVQGKYPTPKGPTDADARRIKNQIEAQRNHDAIQTHRKQNTRPPVS